MEPDAFLHAHASLSERERRSLQRANLPQTERMLARGVSVLTDALYPASLHEAACVPPALFVWGDSSCLESPCVAIVGTRSAGSYGRAAAYKFAERLAEAGVTVVSGGAFGIDAAAHEGALAAGGKTVAVLTGGIDDVYPAKHAPLFERIKASGCLVSQFAIGSRASPYRPLLRNRLIAALSAGVLVVEAPTKSGALSTAAAAAELNRQLFVLPANIDNLNYKGSHALIRDGADLVDHPDQILLALHLETAASKPKPEAAPEGGLAGRILGLLRTEPLSPEMLVERLAQPAPEVLSELTMLELDGRILKKGAAYAFWK